MNTDVENTTIVTGSDKFTLTGTSLVIAPNATYEEWMNYGRYLAQRYSAIQWAIGDWLNFGEMRWGEKYAQALDDLTFSYGTLRNYASICARIPIENRNPKLRFHQIKHVAALQPKEQKKVIETAVKLKLTGDEVLEVVHKVTNKKIPHESREGEIIAIEPIEDNSGNGWLSIYVENVSNWERGQKVTIKIKD